MLYLSLPRMTNMKYVSKISNHTKTQDDNYSAIIPWDDKHSTKSMTNTKYRNSKNCGVSFQPEHRMTWPIFFSAFDSGNRYVGTNNWHQRSGIISKWNGCLANNNQNQSQPPNACLKLEESSLEVRVGWKETVFGSTVDKRKLPFFKQHLRRDDRKRPQEDMHSKKSSV